jgi:hypothetical protein
VTSKYPLIVSTDIVGILGNPNHVLSFWDQVGVDTSKLGIEAIAWSHALPTLSAKTLSQIAGFHSRTSNLKDCISTPILATINSLISTPKQIFNHINNTNYKSPPYILIHSNYHTNLPNSELVNYVFENDTRPGALEDTNRRSTTKNMIIDLFHISLSENLSWSDPIESRKLLSLIESYAPNCFAFHIPIGRVKKDSLPQDISDESLRELKSIMDKNNITPIIECQWGGLDSIYCEPAKSPEKIAHVSAWLSRLNIV